MMGEIRTTTRTRRLRRAVKEFYRETDLKLPKGLQKAFNTIISERNEQWTELVLEGM